MYSECRKDCGCEKPVREQVSVNYENYPNFSLARFKEILDERSREIFNDLDEFYKGIREDLSDLDKYANEDGDVKDLKIFPFVEYITYTTDVYGYVYKKVMDLYELICGKLDERNGERPISDVVLDDRLDDFLDRLFDISYMLREIIKKLTNLDDFIEITRPYGFQNSLKAATMLTEDIYKSLKMLLDFTYNSEY